MGKHTVVGEFEQVVLLAILRLGGDAWAVRIRQEIEREADRDVSRGALYRTLDRLEAKGLLQWEEGADGPARGGHPRRVFRVTAEGVRALRASRATLLNLWDGLEGVLER